LQQLDDIFAADHRRGGGNVRRWGGLHLGGAWASRSIHVYGPVLTNTSSIFVRQSVLDGSRKWNPDYRIVPGGWSEVLETLARDRNGISFAPPLPGNHGVKALSVAASSRSPCYPLTERTVEEGAYPLIRTVDVALDRSPGAPIRPEVREFLRFILSREGQRIIVSDGAYLPLTATGLQQQLRRLQ
jgi:phosphate transport system substrate-binding protein